MILLLKDLTSNSRDGACGSTLVLAKDKNAKGLYYLTSNDTDETDDEWKDMGEVNLLTAAHDFAYNKIRPKGVFSVP